MKTAFAFILSLCCIAATAQPFTPELNQYGEVRTSITKPQNIFPNPSRFFHDEEVKKIMFTKVGEDMYYEIMNYSHSEEWPVELRNTYSPGFKEALGKYKMYFIVSYKYMYDKAVLRVPYEENKNLPAGLLREDKTDFYIVVDLESVADFAELKWATTNKPGSYPESLYARNYKNVPAATTSSPGSEEFNKGVNAEKKREFKEAIIQYTAAADKGNVSAMYNIGALHYNGNTGEEYDSKKIVEQTTNPGAALKKQYTEAMKWFKKAADNGSANAMYIIGLMYEEGKGVDTNITEAKKWLQQAADKGHAKAKEELKTL